jgi:L-fuconolactonase
MAFHRIDTHQHFWNFVPASYDWISEDMAVLRRDYAPAELRPLLERAGVASTLAVEARGHLDETENLLRIAAETDFVSGVVGWLPLMEPSAPAVIEQLSSQSALKGVRHWMGAPDDTSFMTQPALHAGVALLEQAGLTYDLMLWPLQLPAAAAFVDRHPRQPFVLDHFAKPFIRAGVLEPWSQELRALARRPNVYCKLSGLTTEADHGRWTLDDLRPYVDVALEAFGPRRLMFGSDWPVCTLATPYQRWVDTVESLIAGASEDERARIWAGTASEAYRLPLAMAVKVP